MHLMRQQQLFPQIFLCSYPFPVHLKSIFVAGASWKVVQGKTKLTLLTYVRSEEDDPLRPTPLDIYLLYYLLRGLFPCFLLFGRIIIKEWDSSPTQRLKFLPPQQPLKILIFPSHPRRKIIILMCIRITIKSTRIFKPRHAEGSFLPFHESF